MLCSARSSLGVSSLFRYLFLVVILLSSTCAISQDGNFSTPLERQFEQLAKIILGSSYEEADVLYFQSRLKQSGGEHNEALRLAEAAIEANPGKAAYHLQLASVLSDELTNAGFFKRISLAKRVRMQLDTALKLEPKNPDCLFGMMLYYERAPGMLGGSKDKAHELAEQVGRMDASKGYLAQAQLARLEGKSGELEGLYLSAVKADPKSYDAVAALAGFYVSEGQKKKSEVMNRYTQLVAPDRAH